MSQHAQKTKAKPARKAPESGEAAAPPSTERRAKLTDDVDAMLDEIDEALEVNAEDFVKNYVQKGGQ